MEIIAVPCLRDNYAYIVRAAGQVAVVDPSEAAPVLQALQAQGLKPDMIWNTHHHWDHVGGNEALVKHYPELQVFGHGSDQGRLPELNHPVAHEDRFFLGTGPEALEVRVLHNPGHTHGAITYVVSGQAFTGDTLFGAGCGRVFEGTFEEMYQSLNQVIGGLPDATQLYFGHEYTQSNLRFAQAVEPDNAAIQARQQTAAAMGTTLELERATNPFLRCHLPTVQAAAEQQAKKPLESPSKVFAVLRQWKDNF
jgi:hydroxyacylglutathione hydrolase